MARSIVLVACVKKKNSTAMPAQDLYCSVWFQKASAYAVRVADEWYILSAEYGLVPPDTVIEPYDRTLKEMAAPARRAWARQVLDDLAGLLRPGDRVVVLAGKRYRENLVEPMREMGCSVEIPMEGLRQGEQKSWLKRQLE